MCKFFMMLDGLDVYAGICECFKRSGQMLVSSTIGVYHKRAVSTDGISMSDESVSMRLFRAANKVSSVASRAGNSLITQAIGARLKYSV